MHKPKALIVGSPKTIASANHTLASLCGTVILAGALNEAEDALREVKPEIVLTTLRLPRHSSLTATSSEMRGIEVATMAVNHGAKAVAVVNTDGHEHQFVEIVVLGLNALCDKLGKRIEFLSGPPYVDVHKRSNKVDWEAVFHHLLEKQRTYTVTKTLSRPKQ